MAEQEKQGKRLYVSLFSSYVTLRAQSVCKHRNIQQRVCFLFHSKNCSRENQKAERKQVDSGINISKKMEKCCIRVEGFLTVPKCP